MGAISTLTVTGMVASLPGRARLLGAGAKRELAPWSGWAIRLWSIALMLACASSLARAEQAWELPEVIAHARLHRSELAAASASIQAARQRPAQVSALDDPMLTPAIDHYPFEPMSTGDAMDAPESYGRYDWSLGIEQRFPLSGLLTYKRRAADADVRKVQALGDGLSLDIEFSAASAFFMLIEQRRMSEIIDAQKKSAEDVVAAAGTRYAAGFGNQAEVLRAEVEVARLAAQQASLAADIRAAEAMFNASIGRDAQLPVPELVAPTLPLLVPTAEQVRSQALAARAELRAGTAEVERAAADIDAMDAMYSPMAMVRFGYASTMTDGRGAMLMFGVSLPIWRDKLRSGVAEAQAMAQMARADRDAMYRMVEADALAALAQLESAQIQFHRLNDEVLPRAQRVIAPALASYAAGRGSLLSVLEAVQTWRSVEAETVMAYRKLGTAWAQLYRATGQSLENAP
ncbi:MAG: TolC family protein [Pseudomonadota bacterium]